MQIRATCVRSREPRGGVHVLNTPVAASCVDLAAFCLALVFPSAVLVRNVLCAGISGIQLLCFLKEVLSSHRMFRR